MPNTISSADLNPTEQHAQNARGFYRSNNPTRCACGELFSWATSRRTGSRYRARVFSFGERHYGCRFQFHNCNNSSAAADAFAPDMTRVVSTMRTAIDSGLRRPTVTLRCPTTRVAVRFQAVPSGNSVYVRDADRSYGGWVGTIDLNTGEARWNSAATASRSDRGRGVRTVIERFAADPVAYTAECGRHSGSCCYCNRALTDARSTSVGYGPICAQRFGLPWGDTPSVTLRSAATAREARWGSTNVTNRPAPTYAAPAGPECNGCGEHHEATMTCEQLAVAIG